MIGVNLVRVFIQVRAECGFVECASSYIRDNDGRNVLINCFAVETGFQYGRRSLKGTMVISMR